MVWDLNPLNWQRSNLPIRREPERYLPTLANYPALPTFDRFFDDLINGNLPLLPTISTREFVPSLDVSETDGEVKIECELPGMDDKDVDVSLCGNTLCIKGEKKTEKEVKDKDMYRSERRYGSFRRSLDLPLGLDLDKAKADFKNGVLSIALPKTEEYKKQVRSIPISRTAA